MTAPNHHIALKSLLINNYIPHLYYIYIKKGNIRTIALLEQDDSRGKKQRLKAVALTMWIKVSIVFSCIKQQARLFI